MEESTLVALIPLLYPVVTYLTVYLPIRHILELSLDHDPPHTPKDLSHLHCSVPDRLCNSAKYYSEDRGGPHCHKVQNTSSGQAVFTFYRTQLEYPKSRGEGRPPLLD